MAGQTLCVLGRSGAGKSSLVKSSLVKALTGADVLATQAIRKDGNGRHTTARRQPCVLPSGVVVIDLRGHR